MIIKRWIGEKYDGMRCCWNPNKRTAYLLILFLNFTLLYMIEKRYTRAGNEIELLPSIIHSLPTTLFIDCELWYS